jgi:7-cyano-7-deazaguanine synthase
MNALVSSQEGGLQVLAPAIDMTTAELVRRAEVPSSLLAWAHSCHKANVACGACRGCYKYMSTYAELGADYGPVS